MVQLAEAMTRQIAMIEDKCSFTASEADLQELESTVQYLQRARDRIATLKPVRMRCIDITRPSLVRLAVILFSAFGSVTVSRE